jgi:hypothetical protein
MDCNGCEARLVFGAGNCVGGEACCVVVVIRS